MGSPAAAVFAAARAAGRLLGRRRGGGQEGKGGAVVGFAAHVTPGAERPSGWSNTDSLSPPASSLGVLTTDTETPVVTETTVVPELQKKPVRDLELARVCHHSHEALKLLRSNVGEAAADTLDGVPVMWAWMRGFKL
uniref:Uncharacterized protein n=1 Tax=Oryza nivara TaxID=4536 RepID=A0A0E0HX85_ORYNI